MLIRADVTAHAQAQCWKGSSSHEIAMPQSVAIQCARGMRSLQSSLVLPFIYIIFNSCIVWISMALKVGIIQIIIMVMPN